MLRTRRRERIAEPERERIAPKTPPRKVSDKKIRSPGTIEPLKTDAPRGKETEPKRRRRCDDPETIPGATSDNVANDQSGRPSADPKPKAPAGICAGDPWRAGRAQVSRERVRGVSIFFTHLFPVSFTYLLPIFYGYLFQIFCVGLFLGLFRLSFAYLYLFPPIRKRAVEIFCRSFPLAYLLPMPL